MNLEQIYERWERKTVARGVAQGKAQGKAEGVLAVLDARGLTVTVAQRKPAPRPGLSLRRGRHRDGARAQVSRLSTGSSRA